MGSFQGASKSFCAEKNAKNTWWFQMVSEFEEKKQSFERMSQIKNQQNSSLPGRLDFLLAYPGSKWLVSCV